MNRFIAFATLASLSWGAPAQETPALSGKGAFRLNPKLTPADYTAGKAIFKVRPGFRNAFGPGFIAVPDLQARLKGLGTWQVSRRFPRHEAPPAPTNARGQRLVDLSLVYELTFDPSLPVEKVINLLLRSGTVEYADPEYNMQPLYVPNDTAVSSQYHLVNLHAFQGWDIAKGDSSIVIGITDTGTDPDHPDLVNQVKYNYADPVNGIDDDNDGYTDNFAGWDLGDNDNDPSCVNSLYHGSFTTGFSSATPDNITGVAGTGFNCKYLPVKISSGGTLNKAYEGIVYAADHGCQIINCSWGSFGGGSYGQDIIDYATINQGRLVVAAAGNSNSLDPFFPASYKYVLSVSGTDAGDKKWVGSTYDCSVDVCAPADLVFSTVYDDTYATSSGTSFACPQVAGLAGIVMAHFPALTPLQVAEQIRATSDNIDTVPANAPYAHLLGHGRANLFRALTETGALSVRMDDIAITDNNDEAFAANDTLSVTATITNWLNPVNNLTITLSTSSPDVVLLDSVVNVGSMATLAVTDNNADPFRIAISPNVPLNAKVEFLFAYSDGAGYSDEQCLILVLNVDYINVLINDLGTSITSRGRIGYNAPNQAQGIGFTYNDGMSNLFESSFLVGNDTARVSDQMFASPVTVNDTDFVSVDNVRLLDPSTVSDFDLYSRFNDDGAAANKLGVTVTQLTYAWSTPADAKYIIVYYTVINNTPAPVSNVYTGIYADWDIGAIIDNRAGTDAGLKMGYAWEDAANGIYCGARVLGNAPFNVYAVDNDGSGGSLGIYNGFTKAEKFSAMSTPRAAAGTAGSGGDVSVMVASGPYAINGGDSIKVGFALLAADSLSALQAAAQAADLMFMAITSVQEPPAVAFAFPGAWPNPAGGDADIRITLAAATDVELTLFDAAGHRLQVLANGTLAPGQHAVPVKTAGLSDGLYFIRLRTEDRTEVRKFLLSR